MMFARLALAAALVAASAAAIADIRAIERDAGPIVERNYTVAPFRGISVAGPYQIVVRSSGPASAHARGGAALLDETDIHVVDGTLRIEPKRHDGQQIHWRGNRVTTIEVGGGGLLERAALAGSGRIAIDHVAAPRFKGDVAGSGLLDIAQLRTGAASFSIAGSGIARAAGQAQSLAVKVAGSGRADLDRLVSSTANVSVAGSGDVDARVSGTAAIAVMGSGNVALTGGARCTVSRMGSGKATCA
jgi:hypothetical protein